MTLIGSGGQPLVEDKSPRFVLEITATCPRDATKVMVKAEASGLAPISLGQFLDQAIAPVLNQFQQKVVEHENLHTNAQIDLSQKGA